MSATTSLETFLLWVREQRLTGPVTIHCLDGVPRSAHFGAPNRVDFYDPAATQPRTPHRKGLDTPAPQGADSGLENKPT